MPDIASHIPEIVDLNKPIYKTKLAGLYVTEDSEAHVFRIEILRDGKPVDLTGATVSGWFTRYKDNISFPLENGRIEGANIAVIALSKHCYEIRTMFSVAIGLSLGDVDHVVFVGEGQMLANRTDTILNTSGLIPSVEDIIAQYAEMHRVTVETNAAKNAANTAASNANTAANTAQRAASSANTAASGADNAARRANTAAAAIEGMTVTSEDVGASTAASAEITDANGVKNIHFKLRQGKTGNTGATPNITFNAATGEPGTNVQISQSGTPENPVVSLTIPRGIPGEGSVSTVNGIQPDENGNVELGDIGAVKTVDGVSPDENGNVELNAANLNKVITTMSAEAFEALTTAEKVELYASGVRVIAVEGGA